MRNHKQHTVKQNLLFIRTAGVLICVLLSVLLLSSPAFAKNTYVITDGTRVITYTTSATDPETVLDEAGLELGEDDTFTAQARMGTAQITVRRSQTISIDLYGDKMAVISHGETVEQLLKRLNIFPGESDVVSRPLDDETFDGMHIRIDQVIAQDQTYTTTLSHDTAYCYDPSLPKGMETVVTEGIDGEMRHEATVTYVNGREASRVVNSETMTIAPVKEVIALGTGTGDTEPQTQPIILEDKIILPTGEILSYTDVQQFRATAYTHTDAGCDMITATGTTVHIGTVAVDPRVIPYGTRMFIMSNDGAYIYGISVAEDCGGAINGDRLDLYFPTYWECIQFGWRDCTVYFLG